MRICDRRTRVDTACESFQPWRQCYKRKLELLRERLERSKHVRTYDSVAVFGTLSSALTTSVIVLILPSISPCSCVNLAKIHALNPDQTT
jgi:hypothetical protein